MLYKAADAAISLTNHPTNGGSPLSHRMGHQQRLLACRQLPSLWLPEATAPPHYDCAVAAVPGPSSSLRGRSACGCARAELHLPPHWPQIALQGRRRRCILTWPGVRVPTARFFVARCYCALQAASTVTEASRLIAAPLLYPHRCSPGASKASFCCALRVASAFEASLACSSGLHREGQTLIVVSWQCFELLWKPPVHCTEDRIFHPVTACV